MDTFVKEWVTYEELLKAYHDCRKRKRRTVNAMMFEIDDAEKLYDLWVDLNSLNYKIGRSITFCVERPVKREVFAADFRDRIIHHLIINRTMKHFEEEFINDSYSCRVGKGTLYGIKRCAEQIRECSQNYTIPTYVVKCDLKSFFMTANKDLLCEKLTDFMCKHFCDDLDSLTYTLYLMKMVVNNRPQDNCIRKQPKRFWDGLPKEKSLFSCPENLGIPIGNLTSQIFANYFLSEFDNYVINELGIKYYGRYVDDFFFLVHDAGTANDIVEKCRIKFASMGVKLHPKKRYVQRVEHGVKFIGGVVKPGRMYISNRTVGTFWSTVQSYVEKLADFESSGVEPCDEFVQAFVSSVNSYLGSMSHFASYNIRRKVLSPERMFVWSRYCHLDNGCSKMVFNTKIQKVQTTAKSLG